MAFPGPSYRSPRKKEDLKIKEGTIETNNYITKEQQILFEDMGEAILKYFKTKFGIDFKEKGKFVYFDDVKMSNSSKGDGWHKVELYFKVVK